MSEKSNLKGCFGLLLVLGVPLCVFGIIVRSGPPELKLFTAIAVIIGLIIMHSKESSDKK